MQCEDNDEAGASITFPHFVNISSHCYAILPLCIPHDEPSCDRMSVLVLPRPSNYPKLDMRKVFIVPELNGI